MTRGPVPLDALMGDRPVRRHLTMRGPREGNRDWFRIENKKDDEGEDVTDVFIYDEIGFWGTSAQDFVRDLQAIDTSKIHVHLNSPGGEIFDGIAIYNALKMHKAEVTVTVDALAASAASFIAQAGDKVVMTRNATMMIHDGSAFCWGNEADMLETAELLSKLSNNIADIYSQRAGGTVEEWRNLMREEVWYSSSEAVEAGLADEVFGEGEEAENKWDLSIFNHAGRSDAPSPSQVRERVLVNRAKEASSMPKDENGTEGAPATTPAPVVPDVPMTQPEPGTEPGTPEPEQTPEPSTEPAPQNRVTPTFSLLVNGAPMTDMAAVQNYINGLEQFRNETLENARRSFVKALASDKKITEAQVDELVEFALDLNDKQYEKWSASWNAAPSLSLFGKHVGGGSNSGDVTDPVAAEIAKLEGIVNQHRLANMPQDQLEKTPSYMRLQQLKSTNQS